MKNFVKSKYMLLFYLIHSLISSQKKPSPVKPEGQGPHLKFHGEKIREIGTTFLRKFFQKNFVKLKENLFIT